MFTTNPVLLVSTGQINYTMSYLPTRDDELVVVQATLRRLQLTPEEAIKIVSAHIQKLKVDHEQ